LRGPSGLLRGAKRFVLPALAGLLLLAFPAGAPAQAGGAAEVPLPPAPQRWLTDEAGFLSPAAAAELDSRLQGFERSTGHQFLVYIARTTGPTPIDEWAVRAFEKWKVGSRGLDDGLVLFVMSEDRRLRIETGYGLEAVIPDALAGRVIAEEMIPRLEANDPDGAVRAAVERLTAIIAGEAGAAEDGKGEEDQGRPMTLGEKILLGVAVLFFIVLFITNPSLALNLLFSILSGGRGGGRGGFSGGGGRSGGGGASGGW